MCSVKYFVKLATCFLLEQLEEMTFQMQTILQALVKLWKVSLGCVFEIFFFFASGGGPVLLSSFQGRKLSFPVAPCDHYHLRPTLLSICAVHALPKWSE